MLIQFAHFSHHNSNPQTTSLLTKFALIGVVVLAVLFECGQGKETILIDRLQSKNDRILMKLSEEVNSYIQYERYLQGERFQCKAFIKNELSKNSIEYIEQLPVTLDFAKANNLAFSKHITGVGIAGRERIFEVDRILDILNGQCLYYETSTFIYEYCHKEHVRQFDSEYTKLLNAKGEYEDISMGLFHSQKRNARNIKLGISELTDEQRKAKLPKHSNFSADYNFLTVQAIDHKYGDLQFEENSDGNLLHSNAHLAANDDYIQEHPIFMELYCQLHESGDVFINYALVVNPYMLIYTNKKRKCQHLVKHKIAPKKVEYFKDNSSHPIRVYGKYVYGNVQEFCTSSWSWKRNNSHKQLDNHLEEGSLLYFQFFNNHTQKIQYSFTIVKRIITSQLIQLEHQIGKSFTLVSQYEQLDYSTVWTTRFISTVTSCNLLFKKRLSFNKALEFNYLGNSIVRIGEEIKEGDNIGCLCKSIKQEDEKVLDLDVVIRKQLWSNHYSVLVTSNTNIYRRKQYLENILKKCQNYRCFPVIQQAKQLQEEQTNHKFTRIIKISSKNNEFIFDQGLQSQYYILNIKDNGVIRLTTSKDGVIYSYLLTEGQIIKMVEYANGTKEIIKENKYYQNSTRPNSTLHQNYIYIKVNKLTNKTTFGGLWKYSDQVYFPRFQMIGEKLLKLERIKGYAYLRVLNLSLMKHGLAIEKGMKGFEEHYMMVAKATQKKAHLFLSKSYSVNYTYTSGKYCDAPVNKYRKTIVTMKCGKAWFQISQLLQTSPCQYWIEIETALLCRQGFKDVVQSDQTTLSRTSEDAVVNFGILCYPASHFDEAYPYVFINPL